MWLILTGERERERERDRQTVPSVFVENAMERSHAVGVRPVVTFNAGLYLRSG